MQVITCLEKQGLTENTLVIFTRDNGAMLNLGGRNAVKSGHKINGEAIYGTHYWKVNYQENGNLAFTTSGKNLHAIALEKPVLPIIIEVTKGWGKEEVKNVKLLGSDDEINWSIKSEGLEIIPQVSLGKSMLLGLLKLRLIVSNMLQMQYKKMPIKLYKVLKR